MSQSVASYMVIITLKLKRSSEKRREGADNTNQELLLIIGPGYQTNSRTREKKDFISFDLGERGCTFIHS